MWLAGIIGYDSSKIGEGEIKGYKDLRNPKFKGSITLLGDERAIIGITLKKLGYSINETSAEISQYFPYGNPNKEAYKHFNKEMLEDEAVYPDEEKMKIGEYLKDIGEAVKDFDEIWSKVKQ